MRITVGQLRRIIRETIEEETLREAGMMEKIKGMFGKGKPKKEAPKIPPPEVGMNVWYDAYNDSHTGEIISNEGKITSVSKTGNGYELKIESDHGGIVDKTVSDKQWREMLWYSFEGGPNVWGGMPNNWAPEPAQLKSLFGGNHAVRSKKAEEERRSSPQYKEQEAKFKAEKEAYAKAREERRKNMTQKEREEEDERENWERMRHFHGSPY
jgi:hypothetical protein